MIRRLRLLAPLLALGCGVPYPEPRRRDDDDDDPRAPVGLSPRQTKKVRAERDAIAAAEAKRARKRAKRLRDAGGES